MPTNDADAWAALGPFRRTFRANQSATNLGRVDCDGSGSSV